MVNRFVNVRDFGAVGDGVRDDTASLQRAIDTVVAAGPARIILPRRPSGE